MIMSLLMGKARPKSELPKVHSMKKDGSEEEGLGSSPGPPVWPQAGHLVSRTSISV